MIDDEVLATDGAEGEVASDLRSTIENALEKQREAKPAEADEPVEPASEPEKAARDDGRDDKGRFAPKEAKEAAEDGTDNKNVPAEDEPKDAATAEAHKPPIGWSVAAKADWANLPPHVQEAVAKREQEVSQGFARYSGLKQFAEIAEQNGTTLAAAVQDYARVEDGLRRDFLSGLDNLAQRFGFQPAQVAQYYAARHGVPAQGQIEGGAQQPSFDPDAIISEAERRAIARFEQTQAQRESQSEIERFAADPAHAYFENVRGDMAWLLQSGKAETLKDAYEMACWANPATRAIMLKSATLAPSPQDAVQKARAAAKAVGGAPTPGFKPEFKSHSPKATLREEINAAVAMQRG